MNNKKLDLLSIIIEIIGVPTLSLISVFYGWFFMLPNSKSPTLIWIGIMIALMLALLYNPIQGNDYIKILFRYLKDKETFSDEEKVKRSYITSIITIIFICSLIWGFFLYS